MITFNFEAVDNSVVFFQNDTIKIELGNRHDLPREKWQTITITVGNCEVWIDRGVSGPYSSEPQPYNQYSVRCSMSGRELGNGKHGKFDSVKQLRTFLNDGIFEAGSRASSSGFRACGDAIAPHIELIMQAVDAAIPLGVLRV